MEAIECLQQGSFYHVYNRGINSCRLFNEPDNYAYFLSLYSKYINPVIDTYAWVLMPNHFHLLVRIKSLDELDLLDGSEMHLELKPPSQYFSNLFNAYTKAYNKRFARHGALFERPFKRKQIVDEQYLSNIVTYIHNNPVKHGYCSHPVEYGWSSYITCLSDKPTNLCRDDVMEWFGSVEFFESFHRQFNDRGIESHLTGF